MIRPLTIATCLLACGSGLYLYQSKHEVQLLDRQIERTVHDTAALREQSRLLAAEWTMLTNPERLRQFSDTYLSLKTISPQQFTSLADLDGRLPVPQTGVPQNGAAELEQTQDDADIAPADAPEPSAAADPAPAPNGTLPVPPVPGAARTPGVAAVAHPADPKTPDRPPVQHTIATDGQPHAADVHPVDQRASDQHAGRVADGRIPAPPPPRPVVAMPARPASPGNGPVTLQPAAAPSHAPVVASTAPVGGSLLGMARGPMPASPRPTPVNATYNAN